MRQDDYEYAKGNFLAHSDGLGVFGFLAVIMPVMEINRLAPDFSLPDFSGQTHRLSDYRGRIVIINFWSAECPHAERADREMLAYLKEWRERVVLLTVAANANESVEMIAAAARTRNLPLVLRGGSQVLDAYAARTTPHLFVVDVDGILRYQGAFDDGTFRQRTPTRFYLKEAVETLLAGQSPDLAQTLPHGCSIVRYSTDSMLE